ncbi:MAG: NlpC/P60 family protein [Anaerovoracaceae bacterium]
MNRKITLILAVIMMMTIISVPSFAFAAENTVATETKAEVASVKDVDVKLYNSTGVTVSWKGVSGATGYAVYQELEDGTYEGVKYIKDASVRSTVIKNLEKGTTAKFAVRAFYQDEDITEFSEEFVSDSIKIPNLMTRKTKGFRDTTAGEIISLAETKVGSRYVSGAAGPNQFDCSGFTYWIMKTTDASTKSFGRSSASANYSSLKKYDIGSRSLSDAQPGDMVFFNPNGRISHVAFYYGDGKLIHATNPRDGVKITPARWFGNIAGIVRLPNL